MERQTITCVGAPSGGSLIKHPGRNMKTRRFHIRLPQDVLRETVKRRKLLRFLESGEVAWRDEDHPELAKGAAGWVRGLRKESETRAIVRKNARTESDETAPLR